MQDHLQRSFRAVELRARLRWLLSNQTTEAVLCRGFAILALITIVTAYFSETYFFPDEHYQVLEFMAYKLGITSAADLPWEFHARARPFMQSFLYFLIAKPLIVAGVRDLFTVTFILRLATGILSLIALWSFARLIIDDLGRDDEKRAYARMLPFMGFLPYLFVRTASETAAAAFFTLGLVLAVQTVRSPSLRRIALAGLFCGLAFEFRYQSALLSLGLFLWLVLAARVKAAPLAAFVGGGIAALAAGLLVDRWGYGVWCFPPWTYFDLNIIRGVSSRVFGSAPFFAYLYLLPGTIFAPITLVLEIALIIACLRNPKHYLTWATVPFVLVHCLLAHKEERFLFPLAIVATAYPVLAFAPGRPFPWFDRFWSWRRAAKAVGWSAVIAMVFLAVYPFGIRPHLKMAKYLYRHFAVGPVTYTFDEEPFRGYPMYRRPGYHAVALKSRAELASLLARGPVYLASEAPTLPPQALLHGAHATLLYSEFPFAHSFAAAGTRLLCDAADLKRSAPIHPPKLVWMTLYRLERSDASNSGIETSPCTPNWNG